MNAAATCADLFCDRERWAVQRGEYSQGAHFTGLGYRRITKNANGIFMIPPRWSRYDI
jgi:hypothetical protein